MKGFNKMKCTLCGCEKFSSTEIIKGDAAAYVSVYAVVCEKCGHVELFANKETRDRVQIAVKRKSDYEDAMEQLESKSDALVKELSDHKNKLELVQKLITDLEKKANDENITLKKQKEILEKVALEKKRAYILECECEEFKQKIKEANEKIGDLIRKLSLHNR